MSQQDMDKMDIIYFASQMKQKKTATISKPTSHNETHTHTPQNRHK